MLNKILMFIFCNEFKMRKFVVSYEKKCIIDVEATGFIGKKLTEFVNRKRIFCFDFESHCKTKFMPTFRTFSGMLTNQGPLMRKRYFESRLYNSFSRREYWLLSDGAARRKRSCCSE